MATNDYNPATAVAAYFKDRTSKGLSALGDLWTREKLLHDMADAFGVPFFEGNGTDPTILPGYGIGKLWLQVEPGVTTAPGTIRAYRSGDPTLIANWAPAEADTFLATLGGAPGFDYAWSAGTSGDPGTGQMGLDNATFASATTLRISKTGRLGQDYATSIAKWDDASTTVRGRLQVAARASLSLEYAIIAVTGSLSDAGTYYTLPVTVESSSATITDKSLLAALYLASNAGGATGPQWQGDALP
jgi:hypothetical protein